MYKRKILIIGQSLPAVAQTVPYDTTLLFDWLEEAGISKEQAINMFEFEAVYGYGFLGHTKNIENGFTAKSMYLEVDDILVRIGNHLPKVSNIEVYNEDITKVLLVFIEGNVSENDAMHFCNNELSNYDAEFIIVDGNVLSDYDSECIIPVFLK